MAGLRRWRSGPAVPTGAPGCVAGRRHCRRAGRSAPDWCPNWRRTWSTRSPALAGSTAILPFSAVAIGPEIERAVQHDRGRRPGGRADNVRQRSPGGLVADRQGVAQGAKLSPSLAGGLSPPAVRKPAWPARPAGRACAGTARLAGAAGLFLGEAQSPPSNTAGKSATATGPGGSHDASAPWRRQGGGPIFEYCCSVVTTACTDAEAASPDSSAFHRIVGGAGGELGLPGDQLADFADELGGRRCDRRSRCRGDGLGRQIDALPSPVIGSASRRPPQPDRLSPSSPVGLVCSPGSVDQFLLIESRFEFRLDEHHR